MNQSTFAQSRIHQHYIPELDGLRGIAILLVVFFHYFSGYFKIFSFGWTGVDLFFVLSGYLITSRLVKSLNHKSYFTRFYKNRALRILPVYYAVLIGFLIFVNTFLKPENTIAFKYYNQNALSFFLFLQNWIFIKSAPLAEHLAHFWSLSVEEQFYLLWPLVIYFLYKKKYFIQILLVTIICIVILRTNVYFHNIDNYSAYYKNTFCRMDGFIIGGLLFFLPHDILRKVFKVLFPATFLLLITDFLFIDMTPMNAFMGTIGYTVVAIFCAGILFITLEKKSNWLKIFLNQRWLIFLGEISYGLYIFHFIILRFFKYPIVIWLDQHLSVSKDISISVSLTLCLLLSVIISALSYFFFEMYFLKLKRR